MKIEQTMSKPYKQSLLVSGRNSEPNSPRKSVVNYRCSLKLRPYTNPSGLQLGRRSNGDCWEFSSNAFPIVTVSSDQWRQKFIITDFLLGVNHCITGQLGIERKSLIVIQEPARNTRRLNNVSKIWQDCNAKVLTFEGYNGSEVWSLSAKNHLYADFPVLAFPSACCKDWRCIIQQFRFLEFLK